MQSKATEVITIRTTVTTTVKIERTTETKESTTMPVIIVVLDDKGEALKAFPLSYLTTEGR